MLYHSALPSWGPADRRIDLRESPFAPPDWEMSPDEYRGFLRARYKQAKEPFISQASEGRGDARLTIRSPERPDLAEVLYDALLRVGASMGWQIAGGCAESQIADRALYANAHDMPGNK